MSNLPSPFTGNNKKIMEQVHKDCTYVATLQLSINKQIDSIFDGIDINEFTDSEITDWLSVLPECKVRRLIREKLIVRRRNAGTQYRFYEDE